MRNLVVLALVAYAAIGVDSANHRLLGSKECTWGPSYWCSNLTAASGCHAVPHCIQTVWQHKTVPEDKDSICQICLDMVKQARDQLLSNETEEEIKEVFEGSCKLIPIKVINKECCALVDDFIPELVDTLASQMNPQVVCSVAGLCNNVRYDKLIDEYEKDKRNNKAMDSCDGCRTVVDIAQRKFEKMSKDKVLQAFLRVCGKMGSMSDACSNIVITYFKEIYQHLETYLNANDFCLLAGECSARFHAHVEVTPLSDVGFVKFNEKDNLPCELCEQLVRHLRDVLVANTTEEEFHRVLLGLCAQTGKFSVECQSIVDEYYPIIYRALVDELNETVACGMIGICPSPSGEFDSMPIRPLLPAQSAEKAEQLYEGKTIDGLHRVDLEKIKSQKPEDMQLPIERVFPPLGQPEVYNQQACVFCEYLMHYLQEAITEPSTEAEIKQVVDKACSKLPASINETCVAFVNTYGDALIALLAQEFDPSVICPMIKVCPAVDAAEVETISTGNQPKCPMCLFAVSKLEEMIENDRTEQNIQNALDKLCTVLKGNIRWECQDFVDTYSKSVITFLMSYVKAKDVCVMLKLCTDDKVEKPLVEETPKIDDTEILTNEITDYTKNGKVVTVEDDVTVQAKPECIICEFAMSKLDNLLENKTTEDEIKNVVLGLCNHLPKSVRPECTSFVNQYADMIIQLLVGELKPEEVCQRLGLCDKKTEERPQQVIPSKQINVRIIGKPLKSPQCVLCKLVMVQIEKMIIGPTTKQDIEDALKNVCYILPASETQSCLDFINTYGDMIVTLLLQAAQPSEICSLMFLCSVGDDAVLKEIQTCAICEALYINIVNGMLEGMEKVEDACDKVDDEYKDECLQIARKHSVPLVKHAFYSTDVTSVCQDLRYCKGTRPLVRTSRQTVAPVGAKKCTWGPSYWCASPENARECGGGAEEHCRTKVWGRTRREVVLGAEKCTWGPGYWCANMRNAEECSAVNHCRSKVWNGSNPPSK